VLNRHERLDVDEAFAHERDELGAAGERAGAVAERGHGLLDRARP
jgi:hypothetical protein